ncbi:hypothetical protein SELMODRAFT_403927 [Selaginella moellendorffii]|uniref:HD-Zip IV C-terminal domain-containing protein n=1 Tax=Selaginella moellendorffii TaxID=88036 RepID=D8QT07_SELML|nr:hypothetical protein SELMODRAFT_403927 [Selaginella moellendorffii]
MINMMIQGGDPAHVDVLPSGFVILPDGSEPHSTSSVLQNDATSTLLTVAVQILPSAKLSLDSIVAINTLISTHGPERERSSDAEQRALKSQPFSSFSFSRFPGEAFYRVVCWHALQRYHLVKQVVRVFTFVLSCVLFKL